MLALKGKITIIKTLIIPQVQFLFSTKFIPDNTNTLNKIDKILFEFIWDAKPPKIKRNTIIAPIGEGELGMVDIFCVHHAAKISWIRRLSENNDNKWKELSK